MIGQRIFFYYLQFISRTLSILFFLLFNGSVIVESVRLLSVRGDPEG